MIVCRNCGRKNPNGTEFCQNPDCGEYLGFEGEEVATKTFKTVPAPGPSGGPSAQPGGAPTAAPPPPAPVSPTAPTSPLGGPSQPPRPQAGGPMDPGQAERARRLLAKTPGAGQPKARPPAEAEGRQPVTPDVHSEVPALKPGEIACPTCGRGNGPERHFCRQCGTELKAPAPPPLPVPTGPLPPPPPETMVLPPSKPKDDRPFFKRPVPLIITLVLVLVVFLTLIAVLGTSLANSIAGGGGGGATATTAAGGGGGGGGSSDGYKAEVAGTSGDDSAAAKALDGDTATYWEGAAASDDAPDRIAVSFGKTVNLARIMIYAGAAGDEFNDQPRPHRGFLEFPDGSRIDFELQDSPDPQELASFTPVEVDGVSVNITEAYNGGESDPVPITELQFFGP